MGFADSPGAAAGALVKRPLGSLKVEMVASLGEKVSPGVCSRPFHGTWRGTGTAGSRKGKGDQSSAEYQGLYFSLGQKMQPAPEYREIPRGRSGDTMRTGRRSVDGNLYKRYSKD